MNKEYFEHEINEIKKELKKKFGWGDTDGYDMEYKPDVGIDFYWWSYIIDPRAIEVINRTFNKHSYKMDYIAVGMYESPAKSLEDCCYLVVRFIKK